MSPPRLLWHDREPWIYTYREGGFEGYRALFSRRRRAPDLRWYANWRGTMPGRAAPANGPYPSSAIPSDGA